MEKANIHGTTGATVVALEAMSKMATGITDDRAIRLRTLSKYPLNQLVL
jgi:hypothetical protein